MSLWTNIVIIATTLSACGWTGANAALAPKYDRLKQFETVLSGPVLDALGERPIDRVIRRKNGTFLVWANECFVEVTLNAIPPKEGMVGPTTYAIKDVSKIACK